MPDEEFCHVDLWAAEAYLTALDARAVPFLEMLDRGEKIHNWMQAETKAKFPELAKDYTYKQAKQTIHLLNYGGGAGKMQQVSGLPKTVCEWQYTMYHGTFPGIKMRQRRIKAQINKFRCLTSLLGRQKFFFAPLGDELYQQAYAWASQSAIGEITIMALNKIYWVGKAAKTMDKRGIKHDYPWMFPAMNTHDGLVIRCFKGNRDRIREVVKDAFNIPLTIDGTTITIPVEMGWGMSFDELNNAEVIRYD